MNSMSFFFIGLIIIPFTVFIIWLLRQDKKKNYLGLAVLMAAILAAIFVAIYVDAKYMKPL
jgi:prepilin signal peptidase PulO-like enzyme (type II secretory pathway)